MLKTTKESIHGGPVTTRYWPPSISVNMNFLKHTFREGESLVLFIHIHATGALQNERRTAHGSFTTVWSNGFDHHNSVWVFVSHHQEVSI